MKQTEYNVSRLHLAWSVLLIRTTGLRKIDLNCSIFSTDFTLFYSSSLYIKLPVGHQCVSAGLLLLQQQCLAKWAGTMLPDTELHLPVSTCGWLMCCFIYFLSCLSLIHPRMSLPMLHKSDLCLSLVSFLSFLLPSAVGSMHWHSTVTYMCSHFICITI